MEELIERLDLKFNWNVLAATHPADFDLIIDKWFGTDPDQNAESFIQLIERNINFADGDAPGEADEMQITLSGRRNCSLFYSEDQLPSGMGITLPMLVPRKKSEQISSLVFQSHVTILGTEWKWNFVSDEMEMGFGTFHTVWEERLTKADPMIIMVLRLRNIKQNKTLRLDKEDKDTSTTR